MHHHVFSWVSGFGWTLMPFAPFRFEQIPGADRSLLVWHEGVWGRSGAIVSIAEDGGSFLRKRLGLTLFPSRVVEVFAGKARPHWPDAPPSDHWRIENEIFSVRWPAGLALESTAEIPPPFELVGPEQERVWVQGPVALATLPSPEEMRTPDQTVVNVFPGANGAIVELAYEVAGQAWRMFHAIIATLPESTLVVSAQTPAAGRDRLWQFVDEIVTSLEWKPPE